MGAHLHVLAWHWWQLIRISRGVPSVAMPGLWRGLRVPPAFHQHVERICMERICMERMCMERICTKVHQ